ncbi:retrovirus-related Pol polyprotein from transposon 297 [Trichonephila clavipes]|nr:retrovirus-related Pol polyprotein from transposon 297 [Trichonephila clavipes]
MPFGLSGAAPNFQKVIDIILKPVIGKFVNVYMDDVIISSPSFTQHVKHLKEVFRLLHEAALTLNNDKCKFGCDQLKYLGLIINKEGIKTDKTKVQSIVKMKPPRNSKEVSKFIGMPQWYAKFIKIYADLCEPLYNLKRKFKKFIWSIEAQKAFDVIKAAITKAPVLKLPDFKKPFELFTDASSIGVGAVLNQEQRPVVFVSRTLSTAEGNYMVTERECLAVVWALNKFRTYLGSSPVITDHAALTCLTHAPIKLISDNGPQFISDIFENLSERIGIRHVKIVVYRPQANRTERVNRDLVQMIANYVNEQHDTWDQFLREFAYAIRTAVNETMGKTLAELFLGRKLITPFQKLVMVSDGTEFAVGDNERLFEEARRNTKDKHEKWEKYYNRRRHDVQIKVNDWVLIATHPLSSATRKVVAKFKPKFEGPYRVLDAKNNNVVVWKAGKRLTINVDQSTTEISKEHTNKTNKRRRLIRSIPSSWSEKSKRIKRSKNEMLGYKRSHESGSGGPKRKIQKDSEHRVPKRALSSNYKTNSNLPKFRKKSRRDETVTPSTSVYSLRSRSGKRVESRPTIERKTQQGGPV